VLGVSANPFTGIQDAEILDIANREELPYYRIQFFGAVGGRVNFAANCVAPKGRLDWRLNLLRALNAKRGAESPFVLDAGNTLFDAEHLENVNTLQRKRAHAILKAHGVMGVQVQNVGHLDLSAGVDFLRDAAQAAGVELISTNIIDAKGKPAFQTHKFLEIQGQQLAVFGLTAGTKGKSARVRFLDPRKSLESQLASVPREIPVVVLSDLGQNAARELGTTLQRTMLIIGARQDESNDLPYLAGKSIIVKTARWGQQWGTFDFAWRPESETWFSPSIAEYFAPRWDALARELKTGDISLEEVARIRASADDLLRYAPGDLSKKSLYGYGLWDATQDYSLPNELTPVVEKLK